MVGFTSVYSLFFNFLIMEKRRLAQVSFIPLIILSALNCLKQWLRKTVSDSTKNEAGVNSVLAKQGHQWPPLNQWPCLSSYLLWPVRSVWCYWPTCTFLDFSSFGLLYYTIPDVFFLLLWLSFLFLSLASFFLPTKVGITSTFCPLHYLL